MANIAQNIEHTTEAPESVRGSEDDETSVTTDQSFADKNIADIRLTFGRFFLVLMAGQEERNYDRLVTQRKDKPVFKARNLPLLCIVWGSLLYTFYSLVSLVLFGVVSILS